LEKKIRALEAQLVSVAQKSTSYISKSEVHVESESQKRELEACYAKIKNQHDRMEQLEQQVCKEKEENDHLKIDNKHQEDMVKDLLKKMEHAAKEADEKAECEMKELQKMAKENSHTHVEISFSYNLSL
jgi:predicted RNase H-like nuclease (RuvC/YqgF family)